MIDVSARPDATRIPRPTIALLRGHLICTFDIAKPSDGWYGTAGGDPQRGYAHLPEGSRAPVYVEPKTAAGAGVREEPAGQRAVLRRQRDPRQALFEALPDIRGGREGLPVPSGGHARGCDDHLQ